MNFLKNIFGKTPTVQKQGFALEEILPAQIKSPTDSINDDFKPVYPNVTKPADKIRNLFYLIVPYCEDTLNTGQQIFELHTADSGLKLFGNANRAIIRYKDTDLISFDFKVCFRDEAGIIMFCDKTTKGWVLDGLWSENAYSDFKIYFDELEKQKLKDKEKLQNEFNQKILNVMEDYQPIKVERYMSSERISGDTTYC